MKSLFFCYQGYLSQFYTDVGVTNTSVQRIVKSSFREDLQTMQAFFGLEVIQMNEGVEVLTRCQMAKCSLFFKPHFHNVYHVVASYPPLTIR